MSSVESWGPSYSVAMSPESLHLRQRVDVPGHEDDEVAPEHATPASSSLHDRLDAAARRKQAQQSRLAKLLQKDSKFGRCKVHGTKMMPHLLYCSRWFRFRRPSSERCWESRALSSGEFALLPPFLRQ